MIPPDEALRLIRENTRTLPPERVALAEACGRILAEDVRASTDLPPFDNSAMDGFAVRARDCAGAANGTPVALAVKETVRAGVPCGASVSEGEAVRIMTGAPIPPGADAVVMKELTETDERGRVLVRRAPRPGEHVRDSGEDVKAGSALLSAGAKLRPYEIALLAAQGVERVSVQSRPRALILATGDELVPVGAPLSPGKIRNSNGPSAAAALSRWGARATDAGIVPDQPDALGRALEERGNHADLIVVTGGVSAGDFDHTKSSLEAVGFETVFWKAAIKPGKPLLFGLWRGKPVFGLPGNPVAVLVCLEEFVRCAVERLQGCAPGYPSHHLTGKALNDYPAAADRQQYLFCRANAVAGGYELEILRPQGSAMMAMACRADALAVAPLGGGPVRAGDALAFRWLK